MRLSFPASSLTPSVYLPHSSQTDFKTIIKSCCSPVQNPLLASCLPFSKNQSYIMVYKVLHNLHSPCFSHQISFAYSTSISQIFSCLLAFVLAICSAWNAFSPGEPSWSTPALPAHVWMSSYQRGFPEPPIPHTHPSLLYLSYFSS